MSEHKSFRVTDVSLRDIPVFLLAYAILTLLCLLVGSLLTGTPVFWRGIICGVGIGLGVALLFLCPAKKVNVAELPEPSDDVKAKCREPKCSLAVAVKAYRKETGCSLTEGVAVMKDYFAKVHPDERPKK